MTSLDNRQYFPCFDELPLVDEYMDPQYYQDVGGGTMLPLKHWCYIAEIMDDSLSHVSSASGSSSSFSSSLMVQTLCCLHA
jgi:hypothetical protein